MANDKRDNPSDQNGQERLRADFSTEQATGKSGKMETDYSDKPVTAAAVEAPHLSPALQGHLGRQLRAAYSELVHEPMPDKFAKLLEELSVSQSKKPALKQEQE